MCVCVCLKTQRSFGHLVIYVSKYFLISIFENIQGETPTAVKMATPNIVEAFKAIDPFKSLNDKVQCRIWRNMIVGMIKQSKKAKCPEIINENNNNQKSISKLLKEIGINKKKCNISMSSLKQMAEKQKTVVKFQTESINFCLHCSKLENTY